MHHAFIGAAIIGLIAFAFGERAAVIVAQLACMVGLGAALFFAYVVFCAWRNLH